MPDRSVAAGARLLCGGAPVPGPGFFYQPTVLADVPRDAAAAREEVFGPVAAVFRARDLDEAIAILVAQPEVDAALAEATQAMRSRLTEEAFERQVALVKEQQALRDRLANLCQAAEDARQLGPEGD